MLRRRGLLLALVVAAATLAARASLARPPRSDRFDLPAFDAHVYVAMAEHPTVFTVAPWGYRLLTPALVHALPVRNAVKGFRLVTAAGLLLAGVLLYSYLRRLGHGEPGALLAVAAYGLSGPVAESLRYVFLVEPLTLVLELAFLLAVESGAGAAALGLLAALGTLSKEFFVLLVPLVYLRRRASEPERTALVAAALTALPAAAVLLFLRFGWTPYVHAPWPRPGLELLVVAADRVRESWRDWWVAALLLGVTPLALLGGLRGTSRPLLLPCAYLFGITLLAPLLNPVTFFPADIPRLLLYALPAALPLALAALDPRWTCAAPPPASRRLWPAGATLALIVILGVGLDRYRRVDLQGPRDGPLVLALCRETLRVAGRLERGQEVALDPAEQRFVWGESDPGELGQMRWFLRDGWGPRPHYGSGDVVLAEARGDLLVPAFGGGDLEVVLTLDAPAPTRVEVLLGDRRVAEAAAGAGPRVTTVRLPAAALVRGDNVLGLERVAGERPRLRLVRLVLRPVVDGPRPSP